MERRQIQLIGGPLDGMTWLADAGDIDDEDAGAYMIVPGEERRAVYEPVPGGDPGRWLHRGWIG